MGDHGRDEINKRAARRAQAQPTDVQLPEGDEALVQGRAWAAKKLREALTEDELRVLRNVLAVAHMPAGGNARILERLKSMVL